MPRPRRSFMKSNETWALWHFWLANSALLPVWLAGVAGRAPWLATHSLAAHWPARGSVEQSRPASSTARRRPPATPAAAQRWLANTPSNENSGQPPWRHGAPGWPCSATGAGVAGRVRRAAVEAGVGARHAGRGWPHPARFAYLAGCPAAARWFRLAWRPGMR